MATSWLKPLHIGKGRTVSTAIADIIDYAENPEKTDNGNLITGYECDPRVADEEFALSKRQYEHITGRRQSFGSNVIAYHTRQSFKPGEVTPEEANRIGVELVKRFTKGKYAFVVCTHTDRSHIHNHVIFNSTALDCTRKFRNFWGSGKALRRLNDLICIEHGLSVIRDPKPRDKQAHYGAWLGDARKPSYTAQIKQAVDTVLGQSPPDFDAFLVLMEAHGIRASRRGKHLRFFAPGQDKAIRCDTLKGHYTEKAIRERIAGVRTVSSSGGVARALSAEKVNLLIDIQAKIHEGKGTGYKRWAQKFNLKEMAKTLNYLIEHKLTDYAALEKKTAAATVRFNDLSGQIKLVENRLTQISNLQKQISNYHRTCEVYKQYRLAGYSQKFKAEHEGDIILHQSAKKAFDALGTQKLPSFKDLQTEYAALAAEKRKLYRDYRQAKDEMRALATAKNNADHILGTAPGARNVDELRR